MVDCFSFSFLFLFTRPDAKTPENHSTIATNWEQNTPANTERVRYPKKARKKSVYQFQGGIARLSIEGVYASLKKFDKASDYC